jgi:hypothetical protein
MIIDLNKFESIKNIRIDLTNLVPGIYFLINVDDKTPRYTRSRGTYFPDPKGNCVIDRGIDVMNKVPRILKYVGVGNTVYRRLMDHYRFDSSKIDKKKKGLDKMGVGPVFTHVRIIKGFIRLDYDSVRLHHETLLVRKYLPELNKNSQLTDSQKLIILNSEGKVTPYDFMSPYLIHARDIFKAYKAWLIEDMDYIKNELVPYKMENKVGYIHKNKQNPTLYKFNGIKKSFSKWFQQSVLRFHKKQVKANFEHNQKERIYIKLYDEEKYELIMKRTKKNNIKQYMEKGDILRKLSRLYSEMNKKNKKQIELL